MPTDQPTPANGTSIKWTEEGVSLGYSWHVQSATLDSLQTVTVNYWPEAPFCVPGIFLLQMFRQNLSTHIIRIHLVSRLLPARCWAQVELLLDLVGSKTKQHNPSKQNNTRTLANIKVHEYNLKFFGLSKLQLLRLFRTLNTSELKFGYFLHHVSNLSWILNIS